LTPFDVGEEFKNLRINSTQEGGNDKNIEVYQSSTQLIGGP